MKFGFHIFQDEAEKNQRKKKRDWETVVQRLRNNPLEQQLHAVSINTLYLKGIFFLLLASIFFFYVVVRTFFLFTVAAEKYSHFGNIPFLLGAIVALFISIYWFLAGITRGRELKESRTTKENGSPTPTTPTTGDNA